MGPGSSTLTADPRKARRYSREKALERAGRLGGTAVTEDEAWVLVLKHPLPEWAKSRGELMMEAKKRTEQTKEAPQ